MPGWKQEIRRRLASLNLDPVREEVIVEEMEQHLADYYADLLSGGATAAEAYRRTLAELQSGEILGPELQQPEPQPLVPGSTQRRSVRSVLELAVYSS